MLRYIRRFVLVLAPATLVYLGSLSVIWAGLSLFVSAFERLGAADVGDLQEHKETREDIYRLPCSKPDYRAIPGHLNREAQRRSLIDPAYPIRVDLGPQKFAIPWGYFSSRPGATRLNCGTIRDRVSVQYWIPSLDAPEDAIIDKTDNRPIEKTRLNPGPNESVVHVFSIVPYGPKFQKKRSRAEWEIESQNLEDSSEGVVEEYGLWKTLSSKGSLETVYWFRQDEAESFVISCHRSIPRCNASLDLKDQQLDVLFIFAKEAIPQHGVMVAGLRTLLDRWNLHF